MNRDRSRSRERYVRREERSSRDDRRARSRSRDGGARDGGARDGRYRDDSRDRNHDRRKLDRDNDYRRRNDDSRDQRRDRSPDSFGRDSGADTSQRSTFHASTASYANTVSRSAAELLAQYLPPPSAAGGSSIGNSAPTMSSFQQKEQAKRERLALVQSLTQDATSVKDSKPVRPALNKVSSENTHQGSDNENNIEGEDEDDELDLEAQEAEMAATLGFSGFGSTKGKTVAENLHGPATGAVSKSKARKYRQYMNRRGGFNRPLQKMD